MSDRTTEIYIPHQYGKGLSEWGEKSAEEMIFEIRKYAKSLRDHADLIDNTPDHEFQIESFNGKYARKKLKVIQKSSILDDQ